MCTGLAIDISRAQSAKNNLQHAADSAVLYAVVTPEKTHKKLEDKALATLKANLNYKNIAVNDFELIRGKDGSLTVDVEARIPPTFPKVNGFSKLDIRALSTAVASGSEGMELAIAFDTTNSMGFGSTWTTALGTLKDVLGELEQYSGMNNFYVSIVPFADRVNIGTENASWLDKKAPANWNGCAEPRERDNGDVPWALDNEKPNGKNRFIASIPGVTGGLSKRGSGYPYCPNVALTGPTNDIGKVIKAADNFSKSGTGRFDVGMAWTWRVMSKKWRTEFDGIPNSNSKRDARRKIAIMVTDGRTNAYDSEVSAKNSWGWNEGSIDGFENMVRVCDGMKAENIEVFMIRVNGNDYAKSYMEDCATSDNHYFEISDNPSLQVAFKDVLKVVKQDVILVR